MIRPTKNEIENKIEWLRNGEKSRITKRQRDNK